MKRLLLVNFYKTQSIHHFKGVHSFPLVMFPNEQREHNDAHRRATLGLTEAVKVDLSGLSVVKTDSLQMRRPRGIKVMK